MMHASQGIIKVFFRVLLVGLVFLGQVQQELQKFIFINIVALLRATNNDIYFNLE